MEIIKNKGGYIALAGIIIVLSIIALRGCTQETTYSQVYVDSLKKSYDSLAIVAEQAVTRADKISTERDRLKAEGVQTKIVYLNKTKTEKVRELEKVIGRVESDSNKVCLTYDQLDSVNLINIDKMVCEALAVLADEEIAELRIATASYKLGKAKGDTALTTMSNELTHVSTDLESAKGKVKRNRKIALWAALVAVFEGAVILVRR
jgi:hypothetical protein